MSQTFAQLINGKSATVEFSTGSATTPSVAFSGDTNTGIYSPGTDQVAISTGGSGRLFINSAGNTVIGSSTAQAFSGYTTLTVDNATNGGVLCINKNAVNVGNISATNDALTIDGAGGGSSPIVFRTGAATTERVRITTAGLVGIGTSSPSYILEVRQDSSGVPVGINMVDTNASGRSYSIRSDAGQLRFRDVTGSADRITLDSSGRLGIGTASAQQLLHVNGSNATLLITGTTNTSGFQVGVREDGQDVQLLSNGSGGAMRFYTNPSAGVQERARIDSSGRLLVGTSTSRSWSGISSQFQIENTGAGSIASQSIIANTADTLGGFLLLGKSRGTSLGSNTVVQNNDIIGKITFSGADGSALIQGAAIAAEVDGTPGANDMPGRLVFSTTADGASSPTERARITQQGFFKATNTNDYYGSTATYHESRTNAVGNVTHLFSHAGTSGNSYGIQISYAQNRGTQAGDQYIYCNDIAALRMEVRGNGGIANYQANNVNLSDRNVKKDITPASGTWNCIKEWEIVNYRYKDQPDDADLNLGVIAQQVAESCPEVITVFQEAKEATEDQPAQEERLGVKEQQMYWMAIKALQEAQARIEQLEAEMAEVKAQLS